MSTRIGFIGTGNIAQAHAEAIAATPGLALVAVCDPNQAAARRFAVRHRAQGVHEDVDALLQAGGLDAVHILTPPQSHAALARKVAAAGIPFFVEKPIATSAADAEAVVGALAGGLPAAVNQNSLFMPAFARLRAVLADGRLGTVRSIDLDFEPFLKQLAGGQFGHWMFMSPLNLVLEQAVHPLAQALLLDPGLAHPLVASQSPVRASAQGGFVPAFAAVLRGDTTTLTFRFRVGASFPVWRIRAVCDDGIATADMITGICTVEQRTRYLDALDHAISYGATGLSVASQAVGNLVRYGLSTAGALPRGDGFFVGIRESIRHFHRALAEGQRPIHDCRFAARLVALCEEIAAPLQAQLASAAATPGPAAPVAVIPAEATAADALPPAHDRRPALADGALVTVFGGTGFIGKATVARLLARGHRVRVVARGVSNLGELFYRPGVELVRGDVRNAAALPELLGGASAVVNLAHGGGGADYAQVRAGMVDSAVAIARASALAGIARLVHVGSIAGLYLGNADEVVTGATAPDPMPELRGDYARAKAETDLALEAECRRSGLAFVNLRPGVVVGRGAGPFHSGLGFMNNDQHVIGWSHGRNPLPFVLDDDVADAIVAALSADVAGRHFNLAGDVPMSAAEYLDELARALRRPIRFHPTNTRVLWAQEYAKYLVKRVAGRKPRPVTLRDLRSRAMLARLDCSDAKDALNWRPVADRDEFIERAIRVHAA